MAYIAMKTHPNKQLMYDLRGVAAGVSQFVNIYKKFPGLLGAAGDGGVLLHLLLADLSHLLRPHGAVYIYSKIYIPNCKIYFSNFKIYLSDLPNEVLSNQNIYLSTVFAQIEICICPMCPVFSMWVWQNYSGVLHLQL